jgi:predicted HicB family RNase H-like nuclease
MPCKKSDISIDIKQETRGRPPIDTEDRKSERVTFRLTPEEHHSLTEHAKELGLSLNDLICQALSKCKII